MSDDDPNTAYKNHARRLAEEYDELDNPWIKQQMQIDRWWEQRFAEPPEVLTDWSPVARYDEEADYKQLQADKHYARCFVR